MDSLGFQTFAVIFQSQSDLSTLSIRTQDQLRKNKDFFFFTLKKNIGYFALFDEEPRWYTMFTNKENGNSNLKFCLPLLSTTSLKRHECNFPYMLFKSLDLLTKKANICI